MVGTAMHSWHAVGRKGGWAAAGCGAWPFEAVGQPKALLVCFWGVGLKAGGVFLLRDGV